MGTKARIHGDNTPWSFPAWEPKLPRVFSRKQSRSEAFRPTAHNVHTLWVEGPLGNYCFSTVVSDSRFVIWKYLCWRGSPPNTLTLNSPPPNCFSTLGGGRFNNKWVALAHLPRRDSRRDSHAFGGTHEGNHITF